MIMDYAFKVADFVLYKKIKTVKREFNKSTSFDVRVFDEKLSKIAEVLYFFHKKELIKNIEKEHKRVGVLATCLCDNGGHSTCVFNFLKSFVKDYDLRVLLTDKGFTEKVMCNQKISNVLDYAELYGINIQDKKWIDGVVCLYNYIVKENVRVLFVYINPNDVVATVLLSLVTKYAGVKVVFFNHADHCPVLGMMFSNVILEARDSMIKKTKEIRGYDNIIKINLQGNSDKDTVYFSYEEVLAKLNEFGIDSSNYFTITGCAAYKIFDGEVSPYLEMIMDLLEEEPNLKHVLVSELSEKQQKFLDELRAKYNPEISSRLSIVPFQPDFDILFQSCDLFIDSFPQGSALTHIDMMRNKRPTVVKVDKEKPERSFECYLPENYEYAFDNIEDMKKGVLKLLHDKKEQDRVIEQLYKHYIDNFNFRKVKGAYKAIIDEYMQEVS